MDNFIRLYKSKNIVYPQAVARHFGVSINKAYQMCDERTNNKFNSCLTDVCDLKRLYMIRCPKCGNIALSERYYSIVDIPKEEEVGCISCDFEFIPDIDSDVQVFYEKI